MTSVPRGKCGPCCSVAASGNTAIHRPAADPAISGQWMSAQSRGGSREVIEPNVSLDGFALYLYSVPARAFTPKTGHAASHHGPERSTESNHEPGPFATSVNGGPCGRGHGGAVRGGPDRAGQGLVRNQLGRRGR